MKATTGSHLSQRLRVGAIGLAAVVVLIVFAGAILGSVTRQRPATGRIDLATNLSVSNDAATEPLAAMGVAPGTPQRKPALHR